MKMSATILGTKRKYVQRVIRQPKFFVNPLMGNFILKANYNRALYEIERREKVWQDTQKMIDKLSRYIKEEKVEKKVSNMINLPKIEMTLNDARNYEINLLIEKHKARFTPGSKFINLFKMRIGPIRNNWKSVSVTIDTTIRDGMALVWEEDKDITFGPFEEKMPRGLSRQDCYQFLMYGLLKDNRFHPQLGEYIIKICGVTTKLKKVKMADICMGATTLISALVDKCNKNRRINQNNGTCVQVYIYEACIGKDGFKRYMKSSLTEEINKYVFDDKEKKPSTREIINWQDNCHTNMSIYASHVCVISSSDIK